MKILQTQNSEGLIVPQRLVNMLTRNCVSGCGIKDTHKEKIKKRYESKADNPNVIQD